MKLLSLFIILFALQTHALTSGKIALVQYNADLHFNQYNENLQNLTKLADAAVKASANIVVFPEGSLYGYVDSASGNFWCHKSIDGRCVDVKTSAEQIPNGPSTRYWEVYARQNKIYVLFNIPESDDGYYYNTSVIVGPEGYIGKYSKRILYYIDEYYATRGSLPFVLTTPYGKFGLIICADINANFISQYQKNHQVNAIIMQSDWDEVAPEALMDYSGEAVLRRIDIYASDVSAWDGTGKYTAQLGRGKRERNGLTEPAVNIDGLSLHLLNY